MEFFLQVGYEEDTEGGGALGRMDAPRGLPSQSLQAQTGNLITDQTILNRLSFLAPQNTLHTFLPLFTSLSHSLK